MAFNQKNPPWQRNASHQNLSAMQGIVAFPQAQPVYNPNIGLQQQQQQQQNIPILPQMGIQQQQALYSQTVQYPTNRPINAIGFQTQQQSQPTPPPVSQNSSKFNPSNRVFSGTGMVTKLQNDFGFIDDEVFFHKNTCVKGVIPKVGDRVLVDAAYNSNMPFKWNASRVQVLQNTNSSSSGHGNSSQVRSHAGLYSSASSHQSDSRSSNTRNRYSSPARKSPDRPLHRSSNSRSKDDYDESDRRRKRDDRDSDRTPLYREKHQEARSSERGRERERSPIRKPSPKRRRVRSVPRYMVQVPKHLLTIKQADVLELRRRYNNLYIPSDFFVSDIRWTEAFPPDAPFSIRSPCHFHVMHKDVEPPALTASGGESGLDPPDANYLYSAKVMLMSTPPMAEFYSKCLPKSGPGGGDRYDEERDYMHPTRLISFLVGMRGKNETMAIGGPWSPSLDGADPQSDPTVLIRTAIRTCRTLTGIDLSNCSQWYRFVELYYRRSESYHKGRLIPPRVETVVIFLPDVRSCQPTRLEWEQLRLSYKASLARVLNCNSSADNGGGSVGDEVPANAGAQATPSSSSPDDGSKSSTTSSAVAPSSIAASSDAAGVVAESAAPEQAESSEAVAPAGAVAAATADAASSQQKAVDEAAVVAPPPPAGSSHETAAVVSAVNDAVTLAKQPSGDSNTIDGSSSSSSSSSSGSGASSAPPATPAPSSTAAAAAAAAVAAAVAAATPPAVSKMNTTEGSLAASDSGAAELLVEYKKMKVADLKAELSSRKLPTDGIKAVLLSRLSEAVMKEHRELQQKTQQQAEQISEVKQEPAPVNIKEEPIEANPVKMEIDAAGETEADMETDSEPPTVPTSVKEEKPAEVEVEKPVEVKVEKVEEGSAPKEAPVAGGGDVAAAKSESKPGPVAPKPVAATVAGEGEEVAPKAEAKPVVAARKKEEPVKLTEKERQVLERRYQLPEKPHILVHPSRVAKSGKFECSVMSLSVLLDYRPEDTKEHSFEVALFSELFNEMLTRDFGFNIYRAMYALPQAKKDPEEAKKDGPSSDGKAATETGGGTSNGEDGGKATSAPTSEKGDEPRKKSSHADDKEQRDRKRARHSETTDEEGKSRDKDAGKGLLVNSDMLLSFVYFDVTHCGYIAEKDVEDLIYTLGLNLSRSQIRKTVSKATVRDLLLYRKQTDKVQAVTPAPTPQADDTVALADGAGDADKAAERGVAASDTDAKEGTDQDEPQPEKEIPPSVARGNTDYNQQLKASLEQIANEQNGDGHAQQDVESTRAEGNAVSQVSVTKTGIVEYNGCVVDVGKLLEQVRRSESAREEAEKTLHSLQDKHALLVYNNNRATSKIKDLQSEVKTVTRQLSDSMRSARDAVQTQTDYFAVIHHVYERVRPIIHKPSRDGSSSGGSSKRESSKEKSSRTAVSKSEEKKSSKDTGAARKEDDNKSPKEKSGDPPAKAATGEGSGSGSEETIAGGGAQGSPEQSTPLAMETDDPNAAAEKSATDGEQAS